jgi:hypothetical protein
VVSASGEVVLEVVDAEDADDLDVVAEAVRTRYEFTPFDYEAEFPIRMGAVRRDGAITHVVVQYCHLAVDGFGIDAAVRDLAHLDPATGRGTVPVSGSTPRQIAAWQHGPDGARQTERALRYWEGLLRQLAVDRLDRTGPPSEPRFWELIYRSPALLLAATAVAHRTRASLSHVLLAAYSVALARHTGRSPSVAQVLVNNRFRPGYLESVTHLTQASLCVIDVADSKFDDVVARAWKASTSASLFGYFDTAAHNALLARVRAELGDIDIACYVNDRRGQTGGPQPLGDAPTPEQLDEAEGQSTSWWDRRLDTYDGTLYVTFDAAPEAIDLSIVADTHYLGPAQIEALARSIEAVTVEAAFNAVAATGVTAAVADPQRVA